MRRLSFALLVLIPLAFSRVAAQQTTGSLLVPIGGGTTGVYAGFSNVVLENSRTQPVRILVFPLGYASSEDVLSQAEREKRLQEASEAAYLIQEACNEASRQEDLCEAVVAPVLVRSDALNPEVIDYFTDDLSAVIILGGSPGLAMQLLRATPVELALTAFYEGGGIIAGLGTGAGLLSVQTIGDYQPGFSEENSLQSGAVELWNTPEQRGLSFGLTRAVIEPYFYQKGAVGRLLNALARPGSPGVGIGVDADTGVRIRDGIWLEDVFGRYTVTIFDARTYRSAGFSRSQDCSPAGVCPDIASLRNVLVHLLAPGEFAYDLDRRVPSLDPLSGTPGRNFRDLALPAGAGPLFLAGDLSEALDNNPLLSRFVEASGGEQARLVAIAAGYPSDSSAERAAERYAAALGASATPLIIRRNATEPIDLRTGYTGILLVAHDASRLNLELLSPIKDAWLAGTPVLLDNGAAAAAGAFYSNHGPTPIEGAEVETALQGSFIKGRTRLRPGLGLLPVTLEVQLLEDNRWGRFFSLAYSHPELLALGLNSQSGVEIRPDAPLVFGENPIFVLDLGNAQLDLGTNQAFVIANGLLDVFAPGEPVRPEPVGPASPTVRTLTPEPPPPGSVSSPLSTPLSPVSSATPAPTNPIPTGQTAPPEQESMLLRLALPVLVVLLLASGVIVYTARRRS